MNVKQLEAAKQEEMPKLKNGVGEKAEEIKISWAKYWNYKEGGKGYINKLKMGYWKKLCKCWKNSQMVRRAKVKAQNLASVRRKK